MTRILFATSKKDRNEKVSAEDVRVLFDRGLRFRRIKSVLGLSRENLLRAQAAIAALDPEGYERRNGTPVRRYKIAIDVNTTPTFVPSLFRDYGPMAHITYLGHQHDKDFQLWEMLANESYDAIITHDRAMGTEDDLSQIAYDRVAHIMEYLRDKEWQYAVEVNKLPLVIQVKAGMRARDITNAFKRYRAQIHELIDNHPCPYILVSNGGIRMGPSYAEIYQKHFGPVATREDAWGDKWTKKILISRSSQKKALKEEIEEIRKLNRRNAEFCKMIRDGIISVTRCHVSEVSAGSHVRQVYGRAEGSHIPGAAPPPVTPTIKNQFPLPP